MQQCREDNAKLIARIKYNVIFIGLRTRFIWKYKSCKNIELFTAHFIMDLNQMTDSEGRAGIVSRPKYLVWFCNIF